MSILVVAEHDAIGFKAATLNVITAAQKIGGNIDLMVAGDDARGRCHAPPTIAGVSKVIHVTAHSLRFPLRKTLPRRYSHWSPSVTTLMWSRRRRATARMRCRALPRSWTSPRCRRSRRIDSADTSCGHLCRNAFATVKSNDPVKVITVRATAFDAAIAEGGTASVQTVVGVADTGKSRVTGQELTESDTARIDGCTRGYFRRSRPWQR